MWPPYDAPHRITLESRGANAASPWIGGLAVVPDAVLLPMLALIALISS